MFWAKRAFYISAEFYSNAHPITEQALCRLGNRTKRRTFDVEKCEISSFQLEIDKIAGGRPSSDRRLRENYYEYEERTKRGNGDMDE